MAEIPLFLAQRRDQVTTFVPAFATRPRFVYEPGSLGSEISGINIASSDAGSNTLQFGMARVLTTGADMGTGNFVDGGGSSDTITRTTGSFITDGWRVGDRMLVQGAQSIGNDFEVLLTAVAATTLTFATATVNTAEELLPTTKLCRLGRLWYVTVAAGAGAPSVNAVSGLDTDKAPFLDASPDRLLTLGPNDILTAAVGTTMGTGETIDVTVFGADY